MKFSDEYKLTEYYQVQSTIDYITKGKNKLSAGSYGDGIFSILDIFVLCCQPIRVLFSATIQY